MRIAATEWLLLVALGAASGAVFAQPASAPRLATKDEYRACRLAEQAFERRKSRLEALVEQHSRATAQHQAEGSKYMADRQRKGLSTPAEMAAYNQNVARLNARVNELAPMQRDLMKEQDAINAEVLGLNAQCGSQVVPQDMADEVDLEVGKRGTQ